MKKNFVFIAVKSATCNPKVVPLQNQLIMPLLFSHPVNQFTLTTSPIKFSIITASYNSEATIERTFASILNQNYHNLEYIVVDGGSTDKTVSLIQAYEQKFKERKIDFKWISEPDTGIYNAWNKGLQMKSGDWIGFIGSDDIIYSDALAQLSGFLKDKELDYVSAKSRMVRNGRLIREIGEPWNWQTFKREMRVGHTGSFHSSDYFNQHGKFNENFKIAGDYEVLLRAKDQLKADFLDEFIVEMGADGVSSLSVKKAFKEARKAKVETAGRNFFTATLEMKFILLKIKLKRFLIRLNLMD